MPEVDMDQLMLPLNEESDKVQMAEGLIAMTARFADARDRLICKGLIIRSLMNNNREAHEGLL